MDWHFRKANTADASAIAALVQSAYRGESSKAGWTTEADFLAGQRTDVSDVEQIIDTPGQQIVLCTRANGPGAGSAAGHGRHRATCNAPAT